MGHDAFYNRVNNAIGYARLHSEENWFFPSLYTQCCFLLIIGNYCPNTQKEEIFFSSSANESS